MRAAGSAAPPWGASRSRPGPWCVRRPGFADCACYKPVTAMRLSVLTAAQHAMMLRQAQCAGKG